MASHGVREQGGEFFFPAFGLWIKNLDSGRIDPAAVGRSKEFIEPGELRVLPTGPRVKTGGPAPGVYGPFKDMFQVDFRVGPAPLPGSRAAVELKAKDQGEQQGHKEDSRSGP